MQRMERIKKMKDAKELGVYLCNQLEELSCMECDTCPVHSICDRNACGFERFLKGDDRYE